MLVIIFPLFISASLKTTQPLLSLRPHFSSGTSHSITEKNYTGNLTSHLKYVFVCLLGKNAARDINLFLDNASQKVCNIKDFVFSPCLELVIRCL